MSGLDQHEQLVWETADGGICAAVVGEGENFILIPIGTADGTDDAQLQAALARGWTYRGVLGFKDGKAGAKCEPDAGSVYTCLHAGMELAHIIAQHLRRQQGDAVPFLERLWTLPDPRS